MRSRLAVCVLGVLSLVASTTSQAQPPGTIAPPRVYAPAPYDASNSRPAGGVPGYDNYANARGPADGQYCPSPDGLNTEQISGNRGFEYEDTPVDRFLTAAAKSTWIRLEYLNWRFEGPGNTLLGSPVAGIVDPSQPFQATIAGQPATAQVPTTSGLRFRNAQGIRGTMGLPTSAGTLEANFFAFSPKTHDQFLEVAAPNALAPQLQIQYATSTLLNGQPSNNLFLYDSSFEIVQTSELFGAEANWIANSPYETGFVVRPLAGFRYINVKERLLQRGIFDQEGLLVPELVSTINSNVDNRIYAPQLGMRFEWVDQWFTLGIEPKVAFGVNQYGATVRTDRLRSAGDPTVTTSANGIHFAPIGDFSVYGKIHLRDNFSLFVSYQLMVANGISRPADNIFYNDNGSSQPAGIVVDPGFRSMIWQGLTVGGEVKFR